MSLVQDSRALTIRNLWHIRRNPERLLDATVQPIMFTVLFVYVFGGAIPVEGGYRDFLMPGIFVQTLAFTSFGTALGLANDRKSGFVDRLLALPTSRSSLLVGRVSSDMLVTCLTLTILMVTGLAIGWRPHTTVLDFVPRDRPHAPVQPQHDLARRAAGVRRQRARGRHGRRASSCSSRSRSWPTPSCRPRACRPLVQTLAEWNPISAVTAATRELLGNTNAALETSDAWPLVHPVPATLLLCIALTALFAPLALARYRRITRG